MGVFLRRIGNHGIHASLPHARGGVSETWLMWCLIASSSPRTWGCFCGAMRTPASLSVFPTHVGVFLHPRVEDLYRPCLPHARGGVSAGRASKVFGHMSSPRTWGCFRRPRDSFRSLPVFPTHVGVFLDELMQHRQGCSLPHARGGVSMWGDAIGISPESSPRTWGCFST